MDFLDRFLDIERGDHIVVFRKDGSRMSGEVEEVTTEGIYLRSADRTSFVGINEICSLVREPRERMLH